MMNLLIYETRLEGKRWRRIGLAVSGFVVW